MSYTGISSQWNKSNGQSTSFLFWCSLLVWLAPGIASGHIWCLKTGFHKGELRTDVTFKGGKSASLPSSARNSEQTLQLLNFFINFYRMMKIRYIEHPLGKKIKQIDWTSNWRTFSNSHFSSVIQKTCTLWQHQYLASQWQYLALWKDFHNHFCFTYNHRNSLKNSK